MVAERGKAPVPAAQVGGLDSSTVPPGYGREATAKGPVPLHEPDSREGTQVGSLRLRTGENPGWSVRDVTSTSARFPNISNTTDVSPPTYEADRSVRRPIDWSGSPTR